MEDEELEKEVFDKYEWDDCWDFIIDNDESIIYVHSMNSTCSAFYPEIICLDKESKTEICISLDILNAVTQYLNFKSEENKRDERENDRTRTR